VNNPLSPTPNLESLASEGVKLNRHYVFKYCSPTRRSFLSGRYPIHINEGQADICTDHLPLNFTILSQKLKQANFACHFVGKGHLGYETTDHLPVNRGFDSHVGYLHGAETYAYGNHTQEYFTKDFWHDFLPGSDVVEEIYYSTNWYTERAIDIVQKHNKNKPLWLHLPYQAVHAPISDTPAWEHMPKTTTFWNQHYGDMLYVVDKGIGNLTAAIKRRGMWNDTLMIFSSDNGGINNQGNNYPFRGEKMTPWEGGTRVMAFLTGGFLPSELRGTTNDHFLHVADWYPTLCRLVGVDPTDNAIQNGKTYPIDGVDVWPLIVGEGNVTNSREFLPVTSVSLIWKGQYKLITKAGNTSWYAPNNERFPDNRTDWPCRNNATDQPRCLVCFEKSPCLFDILADPQERKDLSKVHPDIVNKLQIQLATYTRYVTGKMSAHDLKKYTCIPNYSNNTWWGPPLYPNVYAGPCCKPKTE